jgi:hypothetical protein
MPTTETANPSPKLDDRGAVCAHYVRCGRTRRRCMRGSPRHGPYYTRYWREDGRRRKESIRLADAPDHRAACDARRRRERDGRRPVAQAWDTWRAILGEVRRHEQPWTS